MQGLGEGCLGGGVAAEGADHREGGREGVGAGGGIEGDVEDGGCVDYGVDGGVVVSACLVEGVSGGGLESCIGWGLGWRRVRTAVSVPVDCVAGGLGVFGHDGGKER